MIYTIGETVLDIIFKSNEPQASKAGGSALNTSVSLARLGANVNFISEIGNDIVGLNIIKFLQENRVGTHNIHQYNQHKTSLALAFLDEQNDAKYEFYKDLPDQVAVQDINFNPDDILLFSSSYALQARTRKMFLSVIKSALDANTVRVYDPNMRKKLYSDSIEYNFLQENVGYAQIFRASDEDCENIFNETNGELIYEKLQALGVEILVLTKNKDGVELFTPYIKKSYKVRPIKPLSTIGAGDTFNAGLIYCLQKNNITSQNIHDQSVEFWDEAIPFAISCSAEVCMSYDNYLSIKNK